MKKILLSLLIMFSMVGPMGTVHAGFLSNLFATPTYTLCGKITDNSQNPLEGITLTYNGDGVGGKKVTHTDSLGNYTLQIPINQSGQLIITGDGYITNKVSLCSYPGGQIVNNYDLCPNWISGKIVDNDNNPLQGVKISIEKNGGLAGVQTAYTDENGDYKIQISENMVYYWITISLDGYKTIRNNDTLYGGSTHNWTLNSL